MRSSRKRKKGIYLFTTKVVGSKYVEDIFEIQRYVEVRSILKLVREPDNKYDQRAILVLDSEDRKLGYIPRKDNLIFSRLLDGGKVLFAKVIAKDLYFDDVEIQIDIYMED